MSKTSNKFSNIKYKYMYIELQFVVRLLGLVSNLFRKIVTPSNYELMQSYYTFFILMLNIY